MLHLGIPCIYSSGDGALTDARSPALLALVSYTLVLADVRFHALLALFPTVLIRADARISSILYIFGIVHLQLRFAFSFSDS